MATVGAAIARFGALQTMRSSKNYIKKAVVDGQKRRSLFTSNVRQVLYFTTKHEWVDVAEGADTGAVGISDHAQRALGDVVYAQLPEENEEFEAGAECGALESVKAASEVYTPVSGTVTEKNAKVEDVPATINLSPEAEGWLFKIKLSKPEELGNLMNAEDYEKFLKSQEDDH